MGAAIAGATYAIITGVHREGHDVSGDVAAAPPTRRHLSEDGTADQHDPAGVDRSGLDEPNGAMALAASGEPGRPELFHMRLVLY
jgi:hypothetical protein